MSFFSSITIVDWIALTGGAIGVFGGIAGGLGAIASCRSNKIAQGARKDSKSANQLATEANGISRESNSIAIDANQIAEESKGLVHRSLLIQSEHHDVDWKIAWKGPRELILINIGEDEALSVRATVGSG